MEWIDPQQGEDVIVPKPGRELDALVAERVMGGALVESTAWMSWDEPPKIRWVCAFDERETLWSPTGDWSPSTDIAAAWTVVEKLNGMNMSVDITAYTDKAHVNIYDGNTRMLPLAQFHAPTAPHAICLAALESVKS